MQPEKSRAVLLLVDVINGFDFPGSEQLARAAHHAAPRILALRSRAHDAGVPVIYVNDNFGRWRSDFRKTIAACSESHLPGHAVTRLLTPLEQDYFVLKPRHSAFYCTTLELLLQQLGAERLVIAGFATNICVLFTAHDAHMRGYEVLVPSDCTASNTEQLTTQALEQLKVVLGANTDEAARLDWAALKGKAE